MASKWAHLKDQFPALPMAPAYGDVLTAQMEAFRAMPMAQVAEEYNDLAEELAEREQEVKELKLKLEAAERVLDQQMEATGLDSAVIAGYRWTPKVEPYPLVTDKSVLRDWVDSHMPDNLALPFQTLRSVVKDALEAGDQLPPGVDVFLKRSFSRTKQ